MLFQNVILTALTFWSTSAIASDNTTSTSSDATTKSGWGGKLSSLMGGLQGVVTVVDPQTLEIEGFQLADASSPALYWWGATGTNLEGGFRISNERVTSPSTGEDLKVMLDAGKTVADFSIVGLWCEMFDVNFGQATLQPGGANMSTASSSSSGASAMANFAVQKSVSGPMGIAAVILAAVSVFL